MYNLYCPHCGAFDSLDKNFPDKGKFQIKCWNPDCAVEGPVVNFVAKDGNSSNLDTDTLKMLYRKGVRMFLLDALEKATQDPQ